MKRNPLNKELPWQLVLAACAIAFNIAYVIANGFSEHVTFYLLELVAGVAALGIYLYFKWPKIFFSKFERWKMEGKCPRCGYDLRVTPRRCPECGWMRGKLV